MERGEAVSVSSLYTVVLSASPTAFVHNSYSAVV